MLIALHFNEQGEVMRERKMTAAQEMGISPIPIMGGDLSCRRVRSGKNPLWHAELLNSPVGIVGASRTADGAIRDWQRQYRRWRQA